MDDRISKHRKEKWIELSFAIEALGASEEAVVSSLKDHVEKLKKVRDVFVYKSEISDARKVDNVNIRDIKEGYSQIANIKLFIKDITAMVSVIILYGPSSIEVLSPERFEIGMDGIQNVANLIAGILHQFASAGVGGVVITPNK